MLPNDQADFVCHCRFVMIVIMGSFLGLKDRMCLADTHFSGEMCIVFTVQKIVAL